MENTDQRILGALEYIRDNPGCDTNHDSLDVDLVECFYNEGVIKATFVSATHPSSRAYSDIRLNFAGKLYLSSLKKPKSANEKSISRWYTNPFLVISLGITGFLFGEYLISYFGLKRTEAPRTGF